MTDANIPSQEELAKMNPDRNSVVYREDDDGVRFRINIISGSSVKSTDARTYTRTFGHYFISEDDDICSEIDELLNEIQSNQSIISSFQRLPTQAYEIQIEVESTIKQMNTKFNGRRSATVEIPSHSQYTEDADSIISSLEELVVE